jgi:uncharacterized protein
LRNGSLCRAKQKLIHPWLSAAIVFGIDWGLRGFCPGPAVAALASGSLSVLLLVAAMIVGQWLASQLR